MSEINVDPETRSLVNRYMSRRGLLGGTVAAGALVAFTGFRRTKEIEAREAQTGQMLYDELGGIIGIGTLVSDFVGTIANDSRINGFFAGTVSGGRVPHLEEMLAEQIANASGGPVQYTGLDMKTTHQGMGITTAAFNALVEDIALSLKKYGISQGAQMALLGALAPLQSQIVEKP